MHNSYCCNFVCDEAATTTGSWKVYMSVLSVNPNPKP